MMDVVFTQQIPSNAVIYFNISPKFQNPTNCPLIWPSWPWNGKYKRVEEPHRTINAKSGNSFLKFYYKQTRGIHPSGLHGFDAIWGLKVESTAGIKAYNSVIRALRISYSILGKQDFNAMSKPLRPTKPYRNRLFFADLARTLELIKGFRWTQVIFLCIYTRRREKCLYDFGRSLCVGYFGGNNELTWFLTWKKYG